jgi:glucose/mannose-6-phosphate isomerase
MAQLTTLDDVEKIRSVDPENMYNRIFDLPEQMAEALSIGQKWPVNPSEFTGIKNIVLIGMGGSAIGGDLIRSYMASKLAIPFFICRNYELPEFVDDESLVIASSYSGNTEETLSALDDALRRKAMIVAMCTGGLMAEVAQLNQIPMITLPSGMQPRAAIGFSAVPLIALFEKLGFLKNATKEVLTVVNRMKTWRDEYIESATIETNIAKRLASAMHNKMPIIYAGPTLTDAVATRWKGQICENAKTLAFANHFAEFNHNELVGWSEQVARFKSQLVVVMLKDSDDHPKIKRRQEIVSRMIMRQGIEVHPAVSRGESTLERIFSLVQLGDFVSYYLAVLNGVDPTPVKIIETLKQELVEKSK